MMTLARPFRDDLAAAIERAECLARENARLRARRARDPYNWIQWSLVSLICLCFAAIVYLGVATG
jgi:hypothetical protein